VFYSSARPNPLWGPPILFSGYRGSFSGVKREGHEIDHLRPSSAEVSEWSCTSAPLVYLLGMDSDNLTFLLPFAVTS
jgi:hypothetical protein